MFVAENDTYIVRYVMLSPKVKFINNARKRKKERKREREREREREKRMTSN